MWVRSTNPRVYPIGQPQLVRGCVGAREPGERERAAAKKYCTAARSSGQELEASPSSTLLKFANSLTTQTDPSSTHPAKRPTTFTSPSSHPKKNHVERSAERTRRLWRRLWRRPRRWPWWFRTARLRPARRGPRDGHLHARMRGRDGLHLHPPPGQGPSLQRPDVPREQDRYRKDRRGSRPHQPGLLHHQAQRRHRGHQFQGRRQVLHRLRKAPAPRQVPAQAQAPAWLRFQGQEAVARRRRRPWRLRWRPRRRRTWWLRRPRRWRRFRWPWWWRPRRRRWFLEGRQPWRQWIRGPRQRRRRLQPGRRWWPWRFRRRPRRRRWFPGLAIIHEPPGIHTPSVSYLLASAGRGMCAVHSPFAREPCIPLG